MKTHLLKNAITTAMIAGFLTGCGGTNEGFDAGFKADKPVEIAMPAFTASVTEETGIQEIDLLAGATSGGQPLTGNINISDISFTVDQNYNTPETPSGGLNNQQVSPFTVKNGKLVVDTDMFSDFLSTCDATDNDKKGPEVNGQPTSDGILDHPPKVTYTVNFAVDNGFTLPAGESLPRRTLTLDVNAVFDGVESITADSAKIFLGDTFTLFATVLPAKACAPEITFDVADDSIATIDGNGKVTPLAEGETSITVTSVNDPTKNITVNLEVFNEFHIDITNQDLDEKGFGTNTKEIPACVHAGFNLRTRSKVEESLSGDYVYDWESSNNSDFPLMEAVNYSISDSVGRFSLGDAPANGEQFDVTVSVASGDTGTTPLAEVEPKTVKATIAKNLMCEPGISNNSAGYNSDFLMDFDGAPWRVVNGGGQGGAVAQSNIALSGSSVEITASTEEYTAILQQVFNKQRNWASSEYGIGTAIGNSYKFAVWVKLPVVPATEVRVQHTLLPWAYEDGPSGPGFQFRRPGAGIMSATLKPTTEWQLLEFTNANGSSVWTVPGIWNIVTDIFVEWDIYGLPAGETILLDEYSVIKLN